MLVAAALLVWWLASRETATDKEIQRQLAELRASQEVVAYDAAGHSSLAPLEAGTLISRRV